MASTVSGNVPLEECSQMSRLDCFRCWWWVRGPSLNLQGGAMRTSEKKDEFSVPNIFKNDPQVRSK